MREFINKYGVVLACVMIVLAGLILFLFRNPGPPKSNSKFSYYINESTGQESKQLATEVPPLSDNQVEVFKISCDNGRNPRAVYYIKYAPDQQKRLIELAQMPAVANADEFRQRDMEKQRLIQDGQWIRRPDSGSPWVLATSHEGQEILTDAVNCPKDQIPTRVFPPG